MHYFDMHNNDNGIKLIIINKINSCFNIVVLKVLAVGGIIFCEWMNFKIIWRIMGIVENLQKTNEDFHAWYVMCVWFIKKIF